MARPRLNEPSDPEEAPGAGSTSDEPSAKRGWPLLLTAEAFGTFALVFAAAGGDAMASISGADRNGGSSRRAGVGRRGDDLCDRRHVGRPFQPRGQPRLRGQTPVPGVASPPLLGRSGHRRAPAALVVQAMFGRTALSAGVTTPHVDDPVAVAIEVVLTLLLVTVVLGTADRHRVIGADAALAVGATIAACGLIALPIEGASMNPVRSLAPALVANDLGNAWIYVLGPVLGAVGGGRSEPLPPRDDRVGCRRPRCGPRRG